MFGWEAVWCGSLLAPQPRAEGTERAQHGETFERLRGVCVMPKSNFCHWSQEWKILAPSSNAAPIGTRQRGACSRAGLLVALAAAAEQRLVTGGFLSGAQVPHSPVFSYRRSNSVFIFIEGFAHFTGCASHLLPALQLSLSSF